METYKSKDIQDRLGISKIQLSHWINSGAIRPYQEDNRRGGSHKFNRQNLIEAAICKELSDLRVPVKSMAQTIDMMHEVGFELWKKFDLLDWYVVFSSVAKFDYKDIDPKMTEYFAKLDTSDFKTFMPILVPRHELLKYLEYMQAAIVLNLNRVLSLVDGG